MCSRGRKILALAIQNVPLEQPAIETEDDVSSTTASFEIENEEKENNISSKITANLEMEDKASTMDDKASTSTVISPSISDQTTDVPYDWPNSEVEHSDSDYIPDNSDDSTTSSYVSEIVEDKNFAIAKPSQRRFVKTVRDYNASENSYTVNDEQLTIAKPAKKDQVKTIRQPDTCYFCETDVLNFARHIQRNHSGEMEVQKIMSLPPGDLIRKQLIATLRKRGNHLKNLDTCQKPVKKTHVSEGENVTYVPCKHCLGYYRPKQLWRHVKKCPENNSQTTQFSHLTDSQNILTKHLSIDPQLRECVFPRMMADRISLVAKKDLLICKFGSRYLKCHREKHLVNVCSRKMRELARLLIEIQKLKPSIKNLYDALQPVYFELFVQATKIVANFDSSTEVFNSPTYAMNIQTSLKQCCDIAILFTLKRRQLNSTTSTAEIESNFRTFKQLLQDAWRFEISSMAATDLSTKKWNKITILPLATDLKKFRDYLMDKARASLDILRNDGKNEQAYKLLMETVFCRLLLLNRKRVGELERMPVHIYKNAGVHQSYEEFSDTITLTEKILLSKFKRVVIRGKRGRGVSVLFSADLQQHVTVLLDLRQNFVTNSNIYLFPKLNTNNPITGYKVMQKHTKKSNLKNPLAITSTRLRKHLATLTQIFNMSSNDIEQLATFMGHTNDIHKQVYRLPDDIYQTVKISKLLMLMEQGKAGEFKGKTLDEINLNLDDEIEYEEDSQQNDDNEDDPEEIIQRPPTPPVQPKPLKNTRVLIPWTEEQKRIAQTYFKDNINQKKPPKKGECEELKSKHPGKFENKTWPQIKVFIQNIYKKK